MVSRVNTSWRRVLNSRSSFRVARVSLLIESREMFDRPSDKNDRLRRIITSVSKPIGFETSRARFVGRADVNRAINYERRISTPLNRPY